MRITITLNKKSGLRITISTREKTASNGNGKRS